MYGEYRAKNWYTPVFEYEESNGAIFKSVRSTWLPDLATGLPDFKVPFICTQISPVLS